MNINKKQISGNVQSFPKLSNPLQKNNLYKLSIFILLHFCVFYNRRLNNGKKYKKNDNKAKKKYGKYF